MIESGRRIISAVFIALAIAALVGCEGSMTPGKMEWVQPDSQSPRAGNAYLLRGWIGLFSHGIDNLTEQINGVGVRAHVYQDDQHRTLGETLVEKYKGVKDPEPLVLIGHSYGADDAVRVARQLDEAGISVDLLFTMDPVTPPELPKNVKVCYNFYQPSIWDAAHVLRGVPLKPEAGFTGKLYNWNIREERKDLLEANTNHINIEKNQKIHTVVIDEVLKICITRSTWLASKGKSSSVNVAAAAVQDPKTSPSGSSSPKASGQTVASETKPTPSGP